MKELWSWVKRNWQTVSYFLVFFACISFASYSLWSGWDDKSSSGKFFPALGLGIIASLLATGVLMLFITYRDSTRLADIDKAVKRFAPLGDQFTVSEIDAVLRNVDVKPEMWLSLIAELESDASTVYFMGSSLRRWRERLIYSQPLINKLQLRAVRAAKSRMSGTKTFETYFCLTEPNAIDAWRKFLIAEVLEDPNAYPVDYGFYLVNISAHTPYSAVCSSVNLVVTPYTAARNVEDSLSIFFKKTGLFYSLYAKDIHYLAAPSVATRELSSTSRGT